MRLSSHAEEFTCLKPRSDLGSDHVCFLVIFVVSFDMVAERVRKTVLVGTSGQVHQEEGGKINGYHIIIIIIIIIIIVRENETKPLRMESSS